MAVNPPPGVDLQADRGPDILRSTVAVAVSATMAVTARLISRRLVKANWNGSDYTVVLGLVGCWALNAVTILSMYPLSELDGLFFSVICVTEQ